MMVWEFAPSEVQEQSLNNRAVPSTRVARGQKSSSFIFELELLYSFKNKLLRKFLCLFTSKLLQSVIFSQL